MELLDKSQVDQGAETAIEEALDKFKRRYLPVRVLSWYHDRPLWYVMEEPEGARVRRLQLALVRRENIPMIEVTADFQIREGSRMRMPRQVRGSLLEHVPLRDVRASSLLEIMERMWDAVADVSPRSREVVGMIEVPVSEAVPSPNEEALLENLTQREREVLTLLASGASSTQIAKRLGVSPSTVRSHVKSLLTKLGVRSRLEAATLAVRTGVERSR